MRHHSILRLTVILLLPYEHLWRQAPALFTDSGVAAGLLATMDGDGRQIQKPLIPVEYAGPGGGVPGLDQVNLASNGASIQLYTTDDPLPPEPY